MAGAFFSPIKMKRKDLDDVNDDFSDFSLSSPARKIRRLDVELPPIMEEEDPESGAVADHHQFVAAEKEAMVDENLERAIVLFKNVNNYPLMLHSPSNFTVSVDSGLISGLKNQYPWSSCSDTAKSIEEANDNSMAVVPWAPSQFHLAQGTDRCGAEALELMDAEQGESAMEIEDNTAETLPPRHENGGLDGMRVNEGLPQWQQQHCLIPQLPFNTVTHISWSR